MTGFKILLACIAIFAVVCLMSIWYASTHFHKVFYRLSSDKISKPVKFVLLADLHDQQYGQDNEKLLKAIEEEHADAVLIAGDILTAEPERGERLAERFVEKLCKKNTVYYGLGNHEAKMGWNRDVYGDTYEAYLTAVKQAGAHVLQNEYLDFQKTGVRIYGLDAAQVYYKRMERVNMDTAYLKECLGEPDMTKYNILLAHNPDYFEAYAEFGADLVLSGHVHGGLIRFPFLGGFIAPSLKLFPKYDGGMFQQGKARMILSRGLGRHGLGLRMWNTAELVVIEMTPTKE